MATTEQITQQPGAPAAVVAQPSLLDQIIDDTRIAISTEERESARDLISEFVSQVSKNHIKQSQDAAAAHAPFITGTNPNMFGLSSFTELGRPSRIDKIFDQVTYAKWKGFRSSE